MWKSREEEAPEYIEGEKYTNGQLEAMANELLRKDSRSELCRKCGKRGLETGYIKSQAQYDDNGKPLIDSEGNHLHIDFPEISCGRHKWFQGEGKARGIGGDNPILFEEHIASRRRREILPVSGTPDPSIVAGIYNRVHKDGRKVNSEEARRKHGASYYR